MEAEIDAGEMSEEIVEIDDEDEGEGNEEESEAGFGFRRELSRKSASKDDGGEQIQTRIDVLVAISGQPGTIGPKISCRHELHHSETEGGLIFESLHCSHMDYLRIESLRKMEEQDCIIYCLVFCVVTYGNRKLN